MPELVNVIPPCVVSRYLSPYPRVRVEVDISLGIAYLARDGFDIALRIGLSTDAGQVRRHLGPLPSVCVASLAYLRNYPALKSPTDLAGHEIVVFTPQKKDSLEITLKHQSGPSAVLRTAGRMRSNSLALLRDLAVLGC